VLFPSYTHDSLLQERLAGFVALAHGLLELPRQIIDSGVIRGVLGLVR
jgi:hypothetical protein